MIDDAHLSNEVVELAEPVPQTFVLLSIFPQGTRSVLDALHAPAVGESLEQRAELGGGLAEGGVAEDLGSLAGGVRAEVLAVADVGLEGVEEPGESLDVVLVLLAFDDDL